MYVPKHWHFVMPVSAVLLTFGINQQVLGGGFHWDYALLVQVPIGAVAFHWGRFIDKAGVAYQYYVTGAPKPEPEPEKREILDWNTGKPVNDFPNLVPLNDNGRQGLIALNQVIDMPAFNAERNFAITTLRMYDFDPAGQKHVNLTEERWVAQKKQFSQKPFANMKKKWEHFGLLKRETANKKSRFIVADRRKVALVASGNPLPQWSPTPPN